MDEAQGLHVEPAARLAIGTWSQGRLPRPVLVAPAPPSFHLAHHIAAGAAHVKDLGDKRPEGNLGSQEAPAAVWPLLAWGKQSVGKKLAKEFVKLPEAAKPLDLLNLLA